MLLNRSRITLMSYTDQSAQCRCISNKPNVSRPAWERLGIAPEELEEVSGEKEEWASLWWLFEAAVEGEDTAPGPPKAGKRSAKGRTKPAPATSPQTSSSSSPSGSPTGDHDPKESASDSKEDNRKTQRPKPSWQDDVRNRHKEDILCIAQCPPRHLATGSYDGEIIVWSVVSERILCRFQIVQPTPPQPSSSFSVVHPTSVLSLMFLKTQAFVPELSSAACLLTSDCKGQVHFWSVLNGGNFLTSFQASQQAIKKLALTSDDSVLFASDFAGFIYAFNIKQYALKPEKKKPPEKVNFWRAHTINISRLLTTGMCLPPHGTCQ